MVASADMTIMPVGLFSRCFCIGPRALPPAEAASLYNATSCQYDIVTHYSVSVGI